MAVEVKTNGHTEILTIPLLAHATDRKPTDVRCVGILQISNALPIKPNFKKSQFFSVVFRLAVFGFACRFVSSSLTTESCYCQCQCQSECQCQCQCQCHANFPFDHHCCHFPFHSANSASKCQQRCKPRVSVRLASTPKTNTFKMALISNNILFSATLLLFDDVKNSAVTLTYK